MNSLYNGKLTSNAKNLRKTMTKEERHLWYDCLKQLPVTVHRQKVLGNYIVDFYIASHKIVVELDGSQHYQEEHHQRDLQRDVFLEEKGCTVVNDDTNKIVVSKINEKKWSRISKVIIEGTWEAIYAETDNRYNKVIEEMTQKSRKYGYDKSVWWWRGKIRERRLQVE